MEGFVKTSGGAPVVPKLNGFQKVAILLGEIGSEAGAMVLSNLNLSTPEITAIRKEMENLGYFNPHNQFHVMREYAVLNEAANFGSIRGIYREVPHHLTKSEQTKENLENISRESPQEIAKLLKMMLEK
ncbi:MAG: hypothetical protein KBT11_00595 [Treponema sp.]|nr:hypothetical protein [Candidatus Treponema equifaecale]